MVYGLQTAVLIWKMAVLEELLSEVQSVLAKLEDFHSGADESSVSRFDTVRAVPQWPPYSDPLKYIED
jgi:hypothetical protein